MRKKIARLFFSNQTLGQTVVKNIFWLGISEVAGRILRMAVVVYAARVLDATGYGVFSNALAVAGLVGVLTDWGISSIFIREAARTVSLRSKYISTTITIRLGLLVVMTLLIWGLGPWMTNLPEVRELFPLMAMLLLFDGLRTFGFAMLRASERMEQEAGLNLLTNLAFIATSLGFLINDPTPYNLALGYVWGSGIGLAATLLALRNKLKMLALGFTRELVVPILDAAWPLVLSGFLGAILMYTDAVMLGWIRTAQDLGWYSAAQKPVQLLAVLPALLASSLLPAMSRLASRDPDKFRSVTEQAMAITVGMALPLVVGGLLMGNQLIDLLYGAGYQPAGRIFSILVIYLVTAFPATIIGNAALAHNLQKRLLPPTALGAIANILLNLALIPRWGALGAATATAVSQAMAQAILYQQMQSILGFRLLRSVKKIALATVAMGLVILGLSVWGINFWITLSAAIVTYFWVLAATREQLVAKLKTILAEG